MTHDPSLAWLGAAELAHAYRARTLSPREVVAACLAAIDARNPALNAFLFVDGERAMDAARASEQRWLSGTARGALDGVPVTVKDLCPARGLPTRSGSLTTSDAPATEEAPAVARLAEDGAVLLGKTAMCEFGWKGVTDSPLGGVSRNPWNPQRTCGGSSGGAAIAAATGMGVLHLGSDGAGSIRIPAAFCGVYGFKATFGRVPSYPPGRLALGHYGPLTRSVRDAALMLNCITRPDARDALALPYVLVDYCAGLDDGVRGLRIAWCPTLCGAESDAQVLRLATDAMCALVDLGAHVTEVDSPIASPREHFDVLWAASMAQVYRKVPEAGRALLDPGFAAVARAGLALDANRLLDAVAARLADSTTMSLFHAHYDLLATPQMPTTAIAAGVDFPGGSGMSAPGRPKREYRSAQHEGSPVTSWLDWSPYAYPFNWTQQPAASVPCGLAPDGLPVALQLVAARFDEPTILRASRALERARPFPSLAVRA